MIELEGLVLWQIYAAALVANRTRGKERLTRRIGWQYDLNLVRDRLAELGLTL